ncbi:MAG: hypothetical protein P8Z00_24640 [Anaerolineales bacterium]|jgi:hypothetical protein
MGKSTLGMIAEFGRQVKDFAGQEVGELVTVGSEGITIHANAERLRYGPGMP